MLFVGVCVCAFVCVSSCLFARLRVVFARVACLCVCMCDIVFVVLRCSFALCVCLLVWCVWLFICWCVHVIVFRLLACLLACVRVCVFVCTCGCVDRLFV